MALSRLLISGTQLHRHSKGFPTPTRWFSSSSSGNPNNSTENESINTHSADVEEPFYLIKAIKEKVSSSWIAKTLTNRAHAMKEDRVSANASEVTKAGKKLATAAPDERSSSQLSESTDSKNHGSEVTTNPTSEIISDKFSGDSITSTDSSQKEKIVDMVDHYLQSEVDPESDMALKRDQEAASSPSSVLNGSVSGKENVIKDWGVTGLNEVTLTEGKDCSSDVKSMECLASNERYKQKETLSSCSSVQMTTSNHQKSFTGESAESFIDPVARDVIKKDERFPVFKLDAQISRNKTSNSARPVGQENGYQPYRVDQGTVTYRDGDQDEAAEMLSHVQPNSDSLKRPTCLEDSGVKGLLDLVKRFHVGTSQSSDDNITNSAKINTPNNGSRSKDRNEAVVTNKTLKHPDQVKRKTSRHGQLMQGKAENQVQHESPMQRRKERSASEILSARSDDDVSFGNDNHSTDQNEAVVRKETLKTPDQVKKKPSKSELFMPFEANSQVQRESQMERQKERSVSEMLLTKSDDNVLFDNTHSLHSDDDKTNTIPVAAMTIQILNEHGHASTSDDAALVHGNGSESDDADSDRKLSKASPFLVDSGVKIVQENVSKSDDAALKCKMPKPRPSIAIDSGIKNVHENGNKSVDAASFCRISKQTPQITLPSQSKSSKKGLKAVLLTEKDRVLTDLLVRFIPKTKEEKHVIEAFSSYGTIDEVHFISSDKEKFFKNAYIRFKTREGMRNALSSRNTILVGAADVLVEALSPTVYTSPRIHPPKLIGIPDVPPSLVENPTRTVMVKGLTHKISSRHLEYAFSFCGPINGFFMGSSSSVAYIEFKTEAAKEKAIESCSILVHGSKLSIFRIDTPCTTVVRIVSGAHSSKMTTICRQYGKVSRILDRSPEITDVHYAYTEWPKMVSILNSLNGLVVDGHRWSVMPAPLIPVEILQILWHQPDGRRRLHALLQNICCKIDDINMAEVQNLIYKYYEEGTETFQS